MARSNDAVSQSPDRLWALDLMRILAAFGVIVLHLSPLPAEHASVYEVPWRISITISILFRWCVPAFLMISGALFLSPEKPFSVSRLYRKTILRIVTCFFFWSAFYAAAHCVIMGKGKWTFLNQLLRGHYHMWYVFVILALYMLTPLLRKMTESKKLTQYFLGLGLVFVFLLPRLLGFVQLFELPHADVVASLQSALAQVNPLSGACPLYYFVLGHYLSAYPAGKGRRRLMVFSGALGFVLTVVLTIWHSARLGESSAQFFDITSITVLLMASGVFVLFRSAFAQFRPGKGLGRVLLTLSACSFGVYLVHPFLIERLQLTLPPSAPALLVGTPLLALGVYALSVLIAFVLRRVPFAGRFIV